MLVFMIPDKYIKKANQFIFKGLKLFQYDKFWTLNIIYWLCCIKLDAKMYIFRCKYEYIPGMPGMASVKPFRAWASDPASIKAHIQAAKIYLIYFFDSDLVLRMQLLINKG